MYRPKLAQVIIVILMLAVLSTAALIHLIWQRAAGENIEEIVASLDAQTAASVRNDLSRTLSLVSSTAEVVRSIFFQGAISANDEVKREFLFLSLLRDQPAIAWIGFGFPDGRFFGSHATADGRIENGRNRRCGSRRAPSATARSLPTDPGRHLFRGAQQGGERLCGTRRPLVSIGQGKRRSRVDGHQRAAEWFRARHGAVKARRGLWEVYRRGDGGREPPAPLRSVAGA